MQDEFILKLRDIWISVAAWTEFAALKKPPKLAYRLLKYQRKLNVELKICEKRRVEIIRELAGIDPNESAETFVSLGQDTQECRQFVVRFNEFLDTESDAELFGLTLDEVFDQLDPSIELSEKTIEILEPFFPLPTARVVELVKSSDSAA